ncbi:hypothetical protein MKW98_023220 [Papaver atlanticum]|uniref:J domain-containing protein n=1 Tax=Papaver atlanticum TaxID=357466 RepID=A0AAD4XUH2_9MAGN|nr:hypothetical protein MKW98_023220 [Papaver atlanticum]
MEISLALKASIGKSDFLCNKRNTISCRVKNNCRSLCIERETNLYELNRRMALQHHPDICPDPSKKQESTRRFVELHKAYQTLSDPVLRYNYDYQLGLLVGTSCDSAVMHTSKFPKEVWENQLSGLQRRSRIRMQRKQN